MTTIRRSLSAVLVATVGAAGLAVAPASTAGLLDRVQQILLLAEPDPTPVDMGWVMGGTFDPDPVKAGYFQHVVDHLLPPAAAGGNIAPLWTPAQFWPVFGNLTFGESVNADVAILTQAILSDNRAGLDQIAGYTVPGPLEPGNKGVVFGYSQSATAATKAMPGLHAALLDRELDPTDLQFVLVGDPNEPLGGILTRFAFPNSATSLPLLNVPLGIGPTPTDLFPTDIYTGAYDGWANFPQDPSNLLADANAIAGILTVHSVYKTFDPDTDPMIDLGTTGLTHFHMIPTEQLPLLWPVYQLGDPGRVLGAGLDPGLRLVIDWGYGNPGMAVHPVDGVLPAGPWAVNAAGALSALDTAGNYIPGSATAGFLPMMDPLQLLVGMQEAGLHSFLDPVQELLKLTGLGALPDWFTGALHWLPDLTTTIDTMVMNGWNELLTSLDLTSLFGMNLLWENIFDGLPLISGAPLIFGAGLIFDLLNAILPIP